MTFKTTREMTILFDNFGCPQINHEDLVYRNFRQFREGPHVYRQGGPMSILLDESLLDMLEDCINSGEQPMFNPLTVGRNKFTVEVVKQDGSIGKITGTLFEPSIKKSENEVLAYTLSLLEQDLVKIFTDNGWRSFYQSKVVSFKFGGDN